MARLSTPRVKRSKFVGRKGFEEISLLGSLEMTKKESLASSPMKDQRPLTQGLMMKLNGKRDVAVKTARDFMQPQDDMDHFTDSPVIVKNNDSTQSESPVSEIGAAAGQDNRKAEMIKVAQLLKMKRDGFRFGMQ